MKLLKVHKTFATGESTVDFRQLAKFRRMYWRKYSGLSPIGEISEDVLAKVQWTFANGERPIGESANWRNSGTP